MNDQNELENLKIKREIIDGMIKVWVDLYKEIDKKIILKELMIKMRKGAKNGTNKK